MSKVTYDLILLLVAIVWGSGFIATDIAVDYWPFIFITALRFSVAALLFAILRPCSLKELRTGLLPGLLVGSFLALGFILQTIALNYTTPAKNAFLTATNVIITPFIYMIFSRKAVKLQTLLGALLALLGIGMLNYDGESWLLRNTGDVLTLICALFFALHIYFAGHFLKTRQLQLDSFVLLQFAAAAILSWPIALSMALSMENLVLPQLLRHWAAATAVVYLGLFSTLLCFFLQNFAQREVSPSKAAVILSLEAVFGALFSVLFYGELLTFNTLWGFILLLLAIFLIELRLPAGQNPK